VGGTNVAANLDPTRFSYDEAFSRNLGWLTEWEQQILRRKRIAIAGMGGVGGAHLLTLVRLGVGEFNLADLDQFELVNFNRQAGATLDTLGRPKVEVMAERALQINPELRLKCFWAGVDRTNLDEFLADVDLLIDGLDFFALSLRRDVNARCAELGIPVVNAAPLGMGAAFLVFKPGSMTFERWFRLDGLSEEDQYLSYLIGMSPKGLHRSYLVDPARVDLNGHRGPSTSAACELCAGVAAAESVKLLLGRGRVRAVPYYHQFDPYVGRWAVGKLRGGNAHPLQRLRIALARPLAARLSRQAQRLPREETSPPGELEAILDLARWAPSGDNLQPWRFEVVDDEHLIVHIRIPGDVYDYEDGEPTLLSAGCLLETLRIVASSRGRGFSWQDLGRREGSHRIAVELARDPNVAPDHLIGFIKVRSVDRRAYHLASLTRAQRKTLEAVLGGELAITWHESLAARWHAAYVNSLATDIRLRIPETFDVHRRVLDWERDFSPHAIPAKAIGFDPVTLRLTRWAMRDWSRVNSLNRFAGTAVARLQMDWIPGVFCGAHFAVSAAHETSPAPAVLLRYGQLFQRFWLTAASLGLALQPTFAPICFGRYGRQNSAFTMAPRARAKARVLANELGCEPVSGPSLVVFRGRIGVSRKRLSDSRSTRLPLHALQSPFVASKSA